MGESPMRNILIIDDEKDFCSLIKIDLEFTGGFKVITATNGKHGLRLTYQHKPHLILLDLMMPRLDGFEVLQRLKEDENTMSIPIIILTARSDDELKLKAAKLFAEDYIVKPVMIAELRDKIVHVLSRAGKA